MDGQDGWGGVHCFVLFCFVLFGAIDRFAGLRWGEMGWDEWRERGNGRS